MGDLSDSLVCRICLPVVAEYWQRGNHHAVNVSLCCRAAVIGHCAVF